MRPARLSRSFPLRGLALMAVLLVSTLCLAQNNGAVANAGANPYAAGEDWWKHAVVYEIYPRSFGDAGNDGMGDLNGITEHLDYLQKLGVDAIWMTPMFPSPQVDFGYDVSDYRAVDPQYGTMQDFDRLVREARKRGIKIVLDFVVNHTSDKHKWFLESEKSRNNPYRDYYIWRDGKGPGEPPNNWTSGFGGSAWKYDAKTGQYYYHFFYPEQPDLNWRNPKVEKEMFNTMRWWFKRGVYGFRLDAVDCVYEDSGLKDNPPEDGVDNFGMPKQKHVNDRSLPEVHAMLQRMRGVVNEYPGRVLIGETWTDTPAQLAAYYGNGSNELQMPMYFNFAMVNKLDAGKFRERIEAVEQNAAGGWPTFVLSNHDIVRQVDRYAPEGADKDQVAKLLAGMLITLRGTPILYFGEELGMRTNTPTRREDVKDIIGQKGWPQEKGRDGERTPMQWNASANAGFNAGAATWLPVGADYKTRNVEAEAADAGSVLNWYRRLIDLRRHDVALAEGDYKTVSSANNVLAYTRTEKTRTVLVVLNFSGEARQLPLEALAPRGVKVLAASSATAEAGRVSLGGYGVLVAEVK
ncbi:MAG: alpha-glucosidase [Acidobacteriota bacterium]|nr:alpha-glucosidase [Acidobacteriota bacterium]